MKAPLGFVVVALSILFVSCTTDGTETSTTDPARDVTATASERFDLSDYEIPEETVCFYLSRYLAVPVEQAADVAQLLNDSSVNNQGVDEGAIQSVLDNTTNVVFPDDDQQVGAALGGAIALFEVPEDDPYQVVLALRDHGRDASPIHLTGHSGHIQFKPGTEPSAISGYVLPDPADRWTGEQIVAVVDSGFVPPDPGDPIPTWMFSSDGDTANDPIRYDSVDVELLSSSNPASHGTFIAGLIRQIAPTATVTLASARPVIRDADTIIQRGEDAPAEVDLYTELHVAEAIQRLIDRHALDKDKMAMTALNLSLGTYTCDPTEDEALTTIRVAIDEWLKHFPRSEVFAAAGNEDYRSPPAINGDPGASYVPFWPAALSMRTNGVHGVATVSTTGVEIVWRSSTVASVSNPPGRYWVTDMAPGADLVNLAGGTVHDADFGEIPALVCWSGSSFSTAVASAQFALGVTPSATDYDSVSGLSFIAPDTGSVHTVDSGLDPLQTEGCNAP